MPHLNIVDRSGERTVELGAATITLGRSSDNPVALDDPKSSRKHSQITLVGSDYFLVDLKSRNGTYLNGKRIEREPLRDGDIITIGDSNITFIGRAPEVEAEGDATLDSSEDFFGGYEEEEEKETPYILAGIAGEVRGQEFKLGAKTTIGRKGLNDIVLNDEKVSGMHAVIVREADKYTLRDLNSTNGTKIRGQRIRQAGLEHGVVFRLGRCEFEFRNPAMPPVEPKTPAEMKVARREHEKAKERPSERKREKVAGEATDFFADEPGTGFLSQEEVASIAARAGRMEGPRILDVVYIVIGVILFCGVLFGAYKIFSGYTDTGEPSLEEGALPIVNHSFEMSGAGAVPGWRIPSDGVKVTSERARSGKRSLEISTGSGEVTIEGPLRVPDNGALIVRYFIAGRDAGLTGAKMRWLNSRYPEYEETAIGWLKRGTFGGHAWVEIEKLFIPPPCADEGVLALWNDDSGDGVVWFDDITVLDQPMDDADEPIDSLSFPSQKNNLQLYATERGLAGVRFKGRPLFWSAGLGSVRQDEIILGQDIAEITDAAERNEVGAIVLSGRVGLKLDEELFACSFREVVSTNGETCITQYRFESDPPESGAGIVFTVGASSLKNLRVTTSGVQAVENVPIIIENVREILFGSKEENTVSVETGAPVTLHVREIKGREQGLVFCEFPKVQPGRGAPGYRLSVGRIPLYRREGLSELIRQADKELQDGNLQKAKEIAKQVLRKSSNPQVKKRADEISAYVEKEQASLKTRIATVVEDVKKYRRPGMKTMFDTLASRIEKAFPNSKFMETLGELRAEVDKAFSGVSAAASNEAAELITLAEMKRVKFPAIALMYYEEVLKRFPDTPEARDARHWSEKLRMDITRRRLR